MGGGHCHGHCNTEAAASCTGYSDVSCTACMALETLTPETTKKILFLYWYYQESYPNPPYQVLTVLNATKIVKVAISQDYETIQ